MSNNEDSPRASVAAVEGDALEQRDPNAKLRDLITLVCDAAFACGECDERDNVNYKPLFEAEQVAITNLKNYVVAIRESRAQPLCAVHKHLEDINALKCEIGNNCVACSLNERRELLQLIAPFTAEGNTEDSLTVLRRVVEFYATQEGEQEREVQCADCQAWFSPNANHTCREQVRRNQRSAPK